MSEFFEIPKSELWPAIWLALGFPLVLLVLNEVIGSCERSGNALLKTLRVLRNLVIPSMALWFLLGWVFKLPQEHLAVRLVESLFWVLLLYALLGVVNDIVFGASSQNQLGERVPKLFRDLVRALLVAVGAMIIYSRVWGHEISGALTALGLGSIVIGLALQEPLGNVVSGLMLLFERPINVGDWVTAAGITGRVIEINWRSVHIETATRELHLIPNVSLYKAAFSNLSRPTPLRSERIEIGFSYDDPPNRVKEVMLELLTSTPNVLNDPPPFVSTVNYADFSVIYRLGFAVASQDQVPVARDSILTRIWYVARREGLTIPFPITMEYAPGENPGRRQPSPADYLKAHSRFKPALKTEDAAQVLDYAAGETVQSPQKKFHGFALVLKGRAQILSENGQRQSVQIGEIGAGECFGDQLTAGGSGENLTIVAAEDLKVLVFEPDAVGDLLGSSPSLAAEIGDAIEARLQAAQAARRRVEPFR